MFDFLKKSALKPVLPKPQKVGFEKRLLTASIFRKAIDQKIPGAAVEYCTKLWEENPFSFSISKTRSTCLGNYKFQNNHHTISVNHDLNQYSFLITLIHEIAHQHVFLTHQKNTRRRTSPHGKEWKMHFQSLIIPLLNEAVFPLEILQPLAAHMKNPAASSTRDSKLMKALKQFNLSDKTDTFHLEDIQTGQSFVFKNRKFQKLEKRRTRALCLELASKRKYTIPLMAEVEAL